MHHHDHHHHGHHHHAPHSEGRGGEIRLLLSIVLNLLITIAEFIGGLISGSLALLSDALHNLSDTTSLGISYAARRVSQREPTRRKTFGYRRAEIIGAFANLITLVIIALYLIKEAVERFFNPQPIDGTVMLVVALIGLLANLLTVALLYRDARQSLNIRSAMLHIITDAVSSVGVVVGGLIILRYGFYLIDPILTLAISLYILYHSYAMLRRTVDILMESTPRGLDLDRIVETIQGLDRVLDMHHLHVWQLDERHTALEAHIVIDKRDLEHMEEIKQTIKETLHGDFHVTHSTLEFEFVPCDPALGADCYEQAERSEPLPLAGRG